MGVLDVIRQVYHEARLTTKIHLAIVDIARTLDIPSKAYRSNMPEVTLDKQKEALSYNNLKNRITFNDTNPRAGSVYEECGHFLHHSVEGTIGTDDKPNDILDFFFSEAMGEGFGYFCSKLADEGRADSFADFCDLIMDDMNQKENLLERLGKSIYGAVEYLTNPEALAALEDLKEYIEHISDQDAFFEAVKNTFGGTDLGFEIENNPLVAHNTFKSMQRCFLLPKEIGTKLSVVIPLAKHDYDAFNSLFHYIGYDIGHALHKIFTDDPEKGKSLAKRIMTESRDNGLINFVKLHKELKELGYSPIPAQDL